MSEAIKHFAEEGKGNAIFLDGSVEGTQRHLCEVTALGQLGKLGLAPGNAQDPPAR